jgi:uracil-DNA glycosylase family 4
MADPVHDSVPRPPPGAGRAERRAALTAAFRQTQTCVRCAELAATRHKVVFGAGNADAELMFVGEAPGASEDQAGLPFVGRAGKLLEQLLGEIGLARGDVFIANVLKCRPPGNRDPLPVEIDNCQEYLFAQVELVAPRVICSLGNFSTKLLRHDPAGITRVHGRPELITLGRRAVRLYPIFHPAAALYTPRMLETLREDFARLPDLLALPAPDQPARAEGPGGSEEPDVLEAAEVADIAVSDERPGHRLEEAAHELGGPEPASPGDAGDGSARSHRAGHPVGVLPGGEGDAGQEAGAAARQAHQLGLF